MAKEATLEGYIVKIYHYIKRNPKFTVEELSEAFCIPRIRVNRILKIITCRYQIQIDRVSYLQINFKDLGK